MYPLVSISEEHNARSPLIIYRCRLIHLHSQPHRARFIKQRLGTRTEMHMPIFPATDVHHMIFAIKTRRSGFDNNCVYVCHILLHSLAKKGQFFQVFANEVSPYH